VKRPISGSATMIGTISIFIPEEEVPIFFSF
jgi:hypothetical protein